MQKWFLILLFSILVSLQACTKQSAKEADNQQKPPAGSAKAPSTASSPSTENQASTPAPTTAEGSAAVGASPPTANPAPTVTEPVPTRPAPPRPLVLPAGTTLTVRLGQALGSKSSHTGDSFTATVIQPVSVQNKVAIPASSSVTGSVVEAQAKGKVKGEAVLKLALKEITVKGHAYPIDTSMASTTEKGKGKRTAVTTGGGALIGGIAGGGKGLAIGAAAGLAGGALTGNKQIEIPAESVLSFQLKKPLTLK